MIHLTQSLTRGLSSDQLKVIFCLAAIWVTPCSTELSGSDSQCRIHITKPKYEYKYFQNGDIIIGGVFSVNFEVKYIKDNTGKNIPVCISSTQARWRGVQTLLFSVDEINKNPDLLPNITLGYHVYDSCGDPRLAIGSVLQILSGPGNMVPNYSCGDEREIAGFIGGRSTGSSLPIAQLLGIYGYTQISYSLIDPVLKDQVWYPYHFSTGPDDNVQHVAIAELVEHLGWTWVIILAAGDERGKRKSQNLRNEITKHGAYVDFIGTLTDDINTNTRTLEGIQKSTAEVVILCAEQFPITTIILVQDIIKEKTLVVPATWVGVSVFPLFKGSLIFQEKIFFFDNSEFEDYLLSIKEDLLLKDLLTVDASCLTHDREKDMIFQNLYGKHFKNCSSLKLRRRDDGRSYRVYTAVYGLAHAEHDMLSSSGQYCNKQVHKNIHRNQTLKSQCSASCPPGYRKVPQNGAPPCCYDCASCSEGEVSNLTDMENCVRCPDYKWPNHAKTLCLEKPLEFLSYDKDPLTLIFNVITLVLFLISLSMLGIFISFRDTPVVKANNRNLSFILLVSIKLSFLSVFLFLGHPVDITCMLRQTSFAITFSTSVSCVLAKTIMVCIAFKASKPGSSWRKWMGPKEANYIAFVCSVIQIVINVIWLVISPPFTEQNIHSKPGIIIIQCNEGSVIAFYIVLSYMGLLASVSFIVAFLARTLPDSFNEAKYITFSMLLFCSVWITMIPAYLSTKGKYMVAVEIFAIISSNCGLLFCIFLPKCYIILLKPEINTKQYLLRNTQKITESL
ncbi:vomeronasal type-2 receptor 26-like [Xenopus laevis]|uniref:Vomeronasal type-2 receptor 26-like n=1 Tax=Xenopus laevis TaxID=8355 RepID=A0A8J1LUJ3_XENLA|nr:vomeronasal type-2 receptor 26-like [Xenopus laevis]